MYDVFLDKDKFIKKKKDLIGAPFGKQIIIFVDDINMPMLEKFGSQPPIEFLRQLIGNGGFYDLKKLNFINLNDSTLLSACAPPGGGRNPVTPRFFRFFNIIWMPELSFKTLEYIYTLILRGFLKENPKDNISNKASKIVKSSIDIYQKLVDKLLPTP